MRRHVHGVWSSHPRYKYFKRHWTFVLEVCRFGSGQGQSRPVSVWMAQPWSQILSSVQYFLSQFYIYCTSHAVLDKSAPVLGKSWTLLGVHGAHERLRPFLHSGQYQHVAILSAAQGVWWEFAGRLCDMIGQIHGKDHVTCDETQCGYSFMHGACLQNKVATDTQSRVDVYSIVI